jgi:hypothetical protein
MHIGVGDTLDNGRFEVLSRSHGDTYMLRDTWSKQELEATIRSEYRSGSAVSEDTIFYLHSEVTHIAAKDGQFFIVRWNETENGNPRGTVLAATPSHGAIRAAWRLLMPGVPERPPQ